MPRPADGRYNLSLPPIPYPLTVIVSPRGIQALGFPDVFPYSATYDLFSIGPDCGLECLGDGRWQLSKGPNILYGTCVPVP